MAMKSCCCGCTVKTGSLIVGYIYAALSGIGAFVCILAMIVIGGMPDFKPTDAEGEEVEHSVMVVKEVVSKLYLLGAVNCLKSLIVNCLLIHGINRTKPALVLPWIIFYVTDMVIQTLLSYGAIALSVNVPTAVWYAITSVSTVIFCIETYILVVVSSHYHRMKKSSLLDEEQIMM